MKQYLIDYTKYRKSELLECLNGIDKDKFPDNYNRLKVEIARRSKPVKSYNDSELMLAASNTDKINEFERYQEVVAEIYRRRRFGEFSPEPSKQQELINAIKEIESSPVTNPTKDKLFVACPKCESMIETLIPANHTCSFCGCNFIYDKNCRTLIVTEIDGTPALQYVPNKIPFKLQAALAFQAILLFVYGLYGLSQNDIYIRGKHGRGIHLHGHAASIAFIAFILSIASMLTIIADHYDKRDNQIAYQRITKTLMASSAITLGIALIDGVINGLLNQ